MGVALLRTGSLASATISPRVLRRFDAVVDKLDIRIGEA
jgi:hypothetical protein